jgi:non-ribosomal peptide synthetase component F
MVGATPLKLPFSRSPPAQRTAETHTVALPLDASVFDNLESLARIEAVSRFVVATALMHAFLGRISGSDDVSLLALSAASQFEVPELASLIGSFLEFLVIRSGRQSGMTFRQLLRRASETMRAAHTHAAVPAAVVLGEPGVSNQPYAPAIINVIEEWRELSSRDRPGLEAVAVRVSAPRVSELTWVVFAHTRHATLVASADTFDRDTAHRLAGSLAALVSHAVAEPDTPVEGLRIGEVSLGHSADDTQGMPSKR